MAKEVQAVAEEIGFAEIAAAGPEPTGTGPGVQFQ